MTEQDTHVGYSAIANFSALVLEAEKAKKALRDLKDEERALNAEGQKGLDLQKEKNATLSEYSKTLAEARKQENLLRTAQAKGNKDLADSTTALTNTVKTETAAVKDSNNSLKETAAETKNVVSAKKEHVTATKEVQVAEEKTTVSIDKQNKFVSAATGLWGKWRQAQKDLQGDVEVEKTTVAVDRQNKLVSVASGLWAKWRTAQKNAYGDNEDFSAGLTRQNQIVARSSALWGKLRKDVSDTNVVHRDAARVIDDVDKSTGRLRGSFAIMTDWWRKLGSAIKGANDEGGKTPTIFDKISKAIPAPGRGQLMALLVPAIASLLGMINPLIAAVGALGGAAIGLASNLGSVGGVAVAIVPGLATLLSTVLSLKVGMSGIGSVFQAYGKWQASLTGTATTPQGQFQEALKALAPAAQTFVKQVISMKKSWDDLKTSVQQSLFSKFTGDLGLLPRLLAPVKTLLTDTAGAVGVLVSKFIQLATSGQWLHDIATLGPQNAKVLGNVGDAVLSVLNAFRDLSIAAGPLLIRMSESLKTVAKSFADVVNTGRSSGDLASWLDKVYTRFQQWWRIIQNVGMTLINYGSAASQFGQWITNSFETMTQGWLAASKRAMEPNSAFQRWLENIKPLLGEVRQLAADLMSWMAKTMGDKSNMEHALSILDMIRTQLGPALGDILSTLAKSGVAESLVEVITSIVKALDALLRNGGTEGLKNFYASITTIFKAIADFIQSGTGKELAHSILPALGSALGVLAVLQFTGVLLMIKGLLGLVSSIPSLMTLFNAIRGAGAAGGVSGLLGGGGAAAGAAGGAGAAAGVAGGAGAAAGGAGLAAVVAPIIAATLAAYEENKYRNIAADQLDQSGNKGAANAVRANPGSPNTPGSMVMPHGTAAENWLGIGPDSSKAAQSAAAYAASRKAATAAEVAAKGPSDALSVSTSNLSTSQLAANAAIFDAASRVSNANKAYSLLTPQSSELARTTNLANTQLFTNAGILAKVNPASSELARTTSLANAALFEHAGMLEKTNTGLGNKSTVLSTLTPQSSELAISTNLVNAALRAHAGLLENTNTGLSSNAKALASLTPQSSELARTTNLVNAALFPIPPLLAATNEEVGKAITPWEQMAASTSLSADNLTYNTTSLGLNAAAMSGQGPLLDTVAAASSAAATATQTATDALGAHTTQVGLNAAALVAAKPAQDDFLGTIGAEYDHLAAVTQGLRDAATAQVDHKLSVQDAATSEQTALATMNGAIQGNNLNWSDNSQATADAKTAIYNYRDAGVATAESIRQHGGTYDEYKAKLEQTRTALSDAMVQMGLTRGQADFLAAQIVKIPTHAQFDLQNNIDHSISQVHDFMAALHNIPGSRDVYINQIWKQIGGPAVVPHGQVAAAYGPRRGGLIDSAEYFRTGGPVQRAERLKSNGPRGEDTVHAWLTPGEFVIRPEVVRAAGADNLSRFNSGTMSFIELLQEAMQSNPSQKDKEKVVSSPTTMASFFNGGGLVPTVNVAPAGVGVSAGSSSFNSSESSTNNAPYFNVENLNILNPIPETASDSLPRSIRKLVHLGGGGTA